MELKLNILNKKSALIVGSDEDKSIIGQIIANNGEYEKHVLTCLESILRENWTCIDIGANIGVISVAIGVLEPSAKIISIEPSAVNFSFLQKNIKNNCINAIAINIGVSDSEKDVTFNYVPSVAGCSFISPVGVKEGIESIVHLKALDQIAIEEGLERLDLIKLDVEGGERLVLAGAIDVISKFKPNLIIEFNPTPMKRFYSDEPVKLFEDLKNLFKYIYLIDENSGSLKEITTFIDLNKYLINGKGWEDLLCTHNEML